MQKKILAAAIAAAFSTGALAAEVTMNGAIDTYVALNHGGDDWESALSSGGVNATHWGLKGTEEIGSSQVFFNLDTAVLSDSGEKAASGGGRMWSREANVGVRGKYGSLSFGRQYTPHFLTFLFYDPTGLSLGSSFSPYFMAGPHSTCGDQGELVRIDNSVSYVLPTNFGLTNFFFAALGEAKRANGGTSSTKGNLYNYAAKYDCGPFSTMLSFAYSNYANEVAGAAKKGSYDVKWLNYAITYDFGVTKPVLEFEKKWGDKDHGSSSFWMVQLGTSTPVFGGKWMISGSYFKNQSRNDADSYSFGTKFNYPLSKRTRIYCGVEATFNEDRAGYAIEAGPDSSLHFNFDPADPNGYSTNYLGKNVQQVFVGISHEF